MLDQTEAFVITILIFVSMLFYSYTIMRIQDFLLDDEFNPGDYAPNLTEVTENLIVRVGKILSEAESSE
tara:strand:- start:563 stop:769 length:207 start_codon:yes stop_codon:yes gene_type:complete